MVTKTAAPKVHSTPPAAKMKPAPKVHSTKPAAEMKPVTRSDMYGALAAVANLSRKQIAGVFDAYAEFARQELGRKGPGVVLLPGMGKIKATRMAPTKAMSKPNPFRPGEMMTVKAKPARTKLKLIASKGWKESL